MNRIIYLRSLVTALVFWLPNFLQATQTSLVKPAKLATGVAAQMLQKARLDILTEKELVLCILNRVDLNAQDLFGKTALMRAAYKNNTSIAELLLTAGADKDIQDIHGWTAVMEAAAAGNTEFAQLLIKHGACCKKQDREGKTALMLALWYQKSATSNTCEVLLAHSDINAQDQNGWTALLFAALRCHKNAICLLLRAGADPYLKSYSPEKIAELLLQSEDMLEQEDLKRCVKNAGSKNLFNICPKLIKDSEIQQAIADNEKILFGKRKSDPHYFEEKERA